MTIQQTFNELKKRRRLGLIPYVTAGYPSMRALAGIIKGLADHGADIIEVGVPFSDPIADGPTIQHATRTALDKGATLARILDLLSGPARNATPLLLMSYLNPLLAYGPDRLFRDLAEAGFAGLLIPDLPVEQSTAFRLGAARRRLALIQMVAPTSTDKRLRAITECADGFVYCVSTTGTTGVRADLPAGLIPFLERTRRVTAKPLAVGFGISTPRQVHGLRRHADGVVIGSRIIEAMRDGADLGRLMNSLARAAED